MKTDIPIVVTKDSYILFDMHQCTPEQVLQYLVDHARPELVNSGDKAARNILLFLIMYRKNGLLATNNTNKHE